MPIASNNTLKFFLITIWVIFVTILSSLNGCRERITIDPTPGMDSSEDKKVKVLLFNNIRNFKIATKSDFEVIDSSLAAPALFAAAEQAVTVRCMSGRIVIGTQRFGKDMYIKPTDPYVLELNEREYRGDIHIISDETTSTFDVVNIVPLEAYLAGVVGAEMPSYWHIEALKAQAVASRTYCLYYKQTYGTNRHYDVRKTEANQVYNGIESETTRVWQAVNETSGEYMVSPKDDDREIFPAFFSSTCGGHTEDGREVFRHGDWPTLQGVRCPYCRQTAKKEFFEWQTVRYKCSEVSKKLIDHYPALTYLKTIVDIVPSRISRYEDFTRIVEFELVGQDGRKHKLEAENLRLTIDPTGRKLRSTAFKIEKDASRGVYVFSQGRGFGHCVGMCQYGAHGLARQGKDYQEILGYYYRGAHLRR